MKSIEEIKNEVAKNSIQGFDNWEHFIRCWELYPDYQHLLEELITEAMHEYAKQCCDEPEWIAINSENDLPKDKNVFYFYAEGGKYYNTTPCNLMFLMSTYNFLKGSDKPVSHYKIIQKPNTPNVVTTK